MFSPRIWTHYVFGIKSSVNLLSIPGMLHLTANHGNANVLLRFYSPWHIPSKYQRNLIGNAKRWTSTKLKKRLLPSLLNYLVAIVFGHPPRRGIDGQLGFEQGRDQMLARMLLHIIKPTCPVHFLLNYFTHRESGRIHHKMDGLTALPTHLEHG